MSIYLSARHMAKVFEIDFANIDYHDDCMVDMYKCALEIFKKYDKQIEELKMADVHHKKSSKVDIVHCLKCDATYPDLDADVCPNCGNADKQHTVLLSP